MLYGDPKEIHCKTAAAHHQALVSLWRGLIIFGKYLPQRIRSCRLKPRRRNAESRRCEFACESFASHSLPSLEGGRHRGHESAGGRTVSRELFKPGIASLSKVDSRVSKLGTHQCYNHVRFRLIGRGIVSGSSLVNPLDVNTYRITKYS